MSLKHALLGFLSYQSMNGYQLKKHFDESVRYFWNASISQIYPTLNTMLGESLIEVKEIKGSSPLSAKTYSITPQGTAELQRWLKEPVQREPLRSPLLIKLFFCGLTEPAVVRAELERQLELARERLKSCEESALHVRQDHIESGDMAHDALFWLMTANYDIKTEEAFIGWCEACLTQLPQP